MWRAAQNFARPPHLPFFQKLLELVEFLLVAKHAGEVADYKLAATTNERLAVGRER